MYSLELSIDLGLLLKVSDKFRLGAFGHHSVARVQKLDTVEKALVTMEEQLFHVASFAKNTAHLALKLSRVHCVIRRMRDRAWIQMEI